MGIVSFTPVAAMKAAAFVTYGYTKTILLTFGQLIVNLFTWTRPAQDLTGPVGIAVMTGQVARQGILALLQFAAILSINLAVVNFLPIPALDGGRVVFLIIERFRRRAMNRRLEAAIHNVAFVILISLILLVTIKDVSRYGGVIVNGVRGLVGL